MRAQADPVAHFDETLQEGAAFKVIVDRDEKDSFRVRIEPLQEQARTLTVDEVQGVLPMGGDWFRALHWHSYMGGAFVDHDRRAWLAVGIIRVETHASRQASPVYHGYLYSRDDESFARLAAGLRALANQLHPVDDALPPEQVEWSRFEQAPSRAPSEHAPYEGRILRAVASSSAREYPYFATLLIGRDQVLRFQELRRHHPVLAVYVQSIADAPSQVHSARTRRPRSRLLRFVKEVCRSWSEHRRLQLEHVPTANLGGTEPETARSLCEAGYALLDAGERGRERLEACCLDARNLFQRALELAPGDVDALSGLARAAALLNEPTQAEALWRDLLNGELDEHVRKTIEAELAKLRARKHQEPQ